MKHLPKIEYKTILHSDQRYDTAGDYYREGGVEHFRVSRMNAEYEFMVLVHEIIEWFLTEQRGIKEKDITKFDLNNIEHPDPGTLNDSPYHKEHMFATKIEKQLCKELGISWEIYNKSFENL